MVRGQEIETAGEVEKIGRIAQRMNTAVECILGLTDQWRDLSCSHLGHGVGHGETVVIGFGGADGPAGQKGRSGSETDCKQSQREQGGLRPPFHTGFDASAGDKSYDWNEENEGDKHEIAANVFSGRSKLIRAPLSHAPRQGEKAANQEFLDNEQHGLFYNGVGTSRSGSMLVKAGRLRLGPIPTLH